MRFVLMDDEDKHNEILWQMLQEACARLDIEPALALMSRQWEDVVAFAGSNTLPCVYMLDIELSQRLDGIELCERVRQLDPGAIVIYVSAYQHYALRCCQSHAFDFLLKPFSPEELENCIQAVSLEMSKVNPSFSLPIHIGGQLILLPLEYVLYFEKRRMLTTAHLLRDGLPETYTWRASFVELMPSLAGLSFVQCHRSFLVNTNSIRAVDWEECTLTLTDGSLLPIARRSLGAMRKALEVVHP